MAERFVGLLVVLGASTALTALGRQMLGIPYGSASLVEFMGLLAVGLGGAVFVLGFAALTTKEPSR